MASVDHTIAYLLNYQGRRTRSPLSHRHRQGCDAMQAHEKKVRDKVWDAKLNFKRNEGREGGRREDDGDARVDIKE